MAIYDFDDIIRTKDLTHYVTGGNGSLSNVYSAFNQYANTDYILFTKNSNYPSSLPMSYSNGIISMDYCQENSSYGYVILPFTKMKGIAEVSFDLKLDKQASLSGASYGVFLCKSDADCSSSGRTTLFYTDSSQQMPDFQHYDVNISDIDREYGYLAINNAYSDKATIKNIKFYTIDVTPSGGAGSGYISNSLLSNKKMVGYNVPTSSAESTKTESTNEASANPVSGKPKIGNGHAKIKLLREAQKIDLFSKFKTTDVSHYKQSSSGVSTYDFQVPNDLLSYAESDWMLFWGAQRKRMPTISDEVITFANTGGASESCVLIPLNSISDVVSFELTVRLSNIPYSNAYAHVGLMQYDSNDGFTFLADTDLVYIYGDNVPSVNEWYTFKKYFNKVRADYLAIMYLIDGKHEIKDLNIEYLN